MARARLTAVLGTAAMVLTFASPVAAQEPSDKAQARALAEEGARAFDRGDLPLALDKLERARALVPVPTIGIEVARTLVALDRLVEAVAAYRIVETMTLDPEMPERFADVQRRTQAQARQERESLEAELPSVRVTGVESTAVVVELDGKRVALDLAAPTLVVDPGAHRIVARRGAEEVSSAFQVARGGQVTVHLGAPASLGPPAAAPPGPAQPRPEPDVVGPEEPVGTLAIVGWTAVGLGGVAGAVSLGTYVHASSLEDDLAARCPDGICLQSNAGAAIEGDVQSYDRARTASMVTFGLGLGLVALGGTLLIIDVAGGDDAPADQATRWSVQLGAGEVGLSGSF